MNYPDIRKNPCFNRTFPVTVNLGDEFSFQGRAVEPSAYGATIEISEYEYNRLRENPALWDNNRRITVSTRLNEISASINALKTCGEGRCLISLKLLDGRTWYQ